MNNTVPLFGGVFFIYRFFTERECHMENLRLIRSERLYPEYGDKHDGSRRNIYVVTNPAWNERLKDEFSHDEFAKHCELLLDVDYVINIKRHHYSSPFTFEAYLV